jgi:hypothetical protein
MLWILETDVFDDDSDNRLIESILKLGHNIQTIKRDYSKSIDLVPSLCSIFRGSLNMTKIFNTTNLFNHGHIPGVICNWKNMECTTYYPKYTDLLLNKHYIVLPYGTLKIYKEFIYHIFDTKDIFVKPNSGDKIFSGQVIQIEKFDEDVDKLGWAGGIDDTTLCIIAEPINITQEYRVVIVDKKAVAASKYKNEGRLDIHEGASVSILNFAEDLVKIWEPDRAFIADIGILRNGNLKLIEINSFSCSGFYAADTDNIVKAASDMALSIEEDTYWKN